MLHRFKHFAACLYLIVFAVTGVYSQTDKQPYVVMVSLDGFRWDFPVIYPTPNLDKLAQSGVRAKFLQPSFPSKTFPNHYTIATGLYPDHHGIIANKFYDTVLNKMFALSKAEKLNPSFYGGQPIWNLAEENGIKAASFYWAGSDVAVNGRQPSIWKLYNSKTTLTERIDSVLYWLQLPLGQRPHLITIYLEEPDGTEHDYGPVSGETRASVKTVDSLIGVLWSGIQQLPVAPEVNLIVLSDHGLAEVSKQKTIPLSQYIPQRWLALPTMGSPIVHLKAAPGYYDSIASAIKKLPHLKGYPSGKIPRRFHFGKNPRTLDFTLIADNGWSIITNPPETIKKGNHGFDNKEPDMRAIFYAAGPAFKKNYVHRAFKNVHVYPLLAHLLNIDAPETDGDFKKVKRLLKK